MPPSQGASIALFMLLAVVVTPEPPPGGVGLRGVVDPAQTASCAGPRARAEADLSRGSVVAGAMPSCSGPVRTRAAGVAPELAK
jgi:hypothetical protein